MLTHPVLLTLAAMICGAPATIAAGVLLPWAVTIGMFAILDQSRLAVANLFLVATSVYALGSYWLLAANTIKKLPFRFGWSFRIGCVAAAFSAVAVFNSVPLSASLLIVVPIVAAAITCVHVQYKRYCRLMKT